MLGARGFDLGTFDADLKQPAKQLYPFLGDASSCRDDKPRGSKCPIFLLVPKTILFIVFGL